MLWGRGRRAALCARNNEDLARWGRVLALFLLILGGLDAASTNVALAAGHIESNPLMRSLQADMSFWWSFPKMGVHLVIAYLILWFPSKRVLVSGSMLSALYILLIINNAVVVSLASGGAIR